MGKIITYKNNARFSFCQIQLDSGERVFVSMGSGTLRISKMLLGLIPTKTLWESGDPKTIIRVLLNEGEIKHPLDAARDKILPLKSIADLQKVFNANTKAAADPTKGNMKSSAPPIGKIINDYGKVLEKYMKDFDMIPISALPYDHDTIKAAIIAALKATSDTTGIELLKVGYVQLACFIPDEEYVIAKEGFAFLFSASMDKSKMTCAEKYADLQKVIARNMANLSAELKEYY